MHDSAVVAMSSSIGEFSRQGRLPVKTLRYDDIGLFTVADVDDLTGYRRYGADQLALLNRILALKALGFSLDHIRRLIEEPVDEAELRGMLVLRRAQIENDLAEATSRITEIESRIHHLDKEHHTMTAAILTKIVPAITFAGAREVVADHELMRERCIALDTLACQTISRLDLRVDGPSCALYYPHDTGIDVEMGYPVRTIASEQIDTSAAGPNVHTLPAAEIAYAVYTGSYDDFATMPPGTSYSPDDETTDVRWFDRNALPEMPPPEMRAVQLAMTGGAAPVFDRR